MMKISVIGAGSGGQAIAGHCASLGIPVCLYNRSLDRISMLAKEQKIQLKGTLDEFGILSKVTDNIQEAAEFGDILMVVTTASAHRSIAEQIYPYLRDGQYVVLNPGRTCGLLEFDSILRLRRPSLQIKLGEAQTLVYACREISPGLINVIGIKQRVMLAGRNKQETNDIIRKLHMIYPCFIPASNLIQTSLENIGAIFHPPVVLFNAATIERNTLFYFYRDMTPNVAAFIQKMDKERIDIGKAFGVKLMPVYDWIEYAYPGTKGDDLCERMRNNPAYHDILGPGSIFTRQLTEDIPTGLIPMSSLASVVNVPTPLMDAVITLSSSLLGINFKENGRTLKNLNLSHLDKEHIIKLLS